MGRIKLKKYQGEGCGGESRNLIFYLQGVFWQDWKERLPEFFNSERVLGSIAGVCSICNPRGYY